MLSLSECFLFPFGSRLVGKMYRDSCTILAGGCPFCFPSGFPGVTGCVVGSWDICWLRGTFVLLNTDELRVLQFLRTLIP